jgi:hypothetical protein
MSKDPMFLSWCAMRRRCSNPADSAYPSYGGRGITVCDRWQVFENFLADMGYRPAGMSLGRIDNDQGYCPENCRWESSRQQNNNKRNNRFIEAFGESATVPEWARRLGIPHTTIETRIARGWLPERALTQPKRKSQCSA